MTLDTEKEIITVKPTVSVDTIQKLPNYVGISEFTAGTSAISMNMVVIPPGAKAEPHFHDGFETAIYVLKGRVKTTYGKHLEKSVVNTEGDFVFIPDGLPHQAINMSDSETAVAIVARNDPNEQESVQLYQHEA